MNNSESELMVYCFQWQALARSRTPSPQAPQVDKSTNLTGLLSQLLSLSDVSDSHSTGSSARNCPKSCLTLDLVTRKPWCWLSVACISFWSSWFVAAQVSSPERESSQLEEWHSWSFTWQDEAHLNTIMQCAYAHVRIRVQ